jgi:DNA primase
VGGYGAARLFSPELLPVAEAILDQVAAHGSSDPALVLERIASPEERSRIAALFVADEHLEEIDPQKAFEQCRLSCERRLLKKMDARELRRELARLDTDSARYWEILRTLDNLRTRKSQLHH